MGKEKQTAMEVQGKSLKLVDVKSEREIIEKITFYTEQMKLTIRAEKLDEIKNKIKKQKSAEKKEIMMDEFIQKNMKLIKEKVLSIGDFDDNWARMKEKIFL